MEIGSVTIRGTATQTAKTAFQVAAGLTTERPTGVAAMMRFNTTRHRFNDGKLHPRSHVYERNGRQLGVCLVGLRRDAREFPRKSYRRYGEPSLHLVQKGLIDVRAH